MNKLLETLNSIRELFGLDPVKDDVKVDPDIKVEMETEVQEVETEETEQVEIVETVETDVIEGEDPDEVIEPQPILDIDQIEELKTLVNDLKNEIKSYKQKSEKEKEQLMKKVEELGSEPADEPISKTTIQEDTKLSKSEIRMKTMSFILDQTNRDEDFVL